MPGYLLDTHALIWAVYDADRLSERASGAIASRAKPIFVSAVSAYEIALKHRLGRLDFARAHAEDFGTELERDAFLNLDLTIEHARVAGMLPLHHRDPFDRMLIAQAQVERMILISNEKRFDAFDVERLW